jgi:hypothetical protein
MNNNKNSTSSIDFQQLTTNWINSQINLQEIGITQGKGVVQQTKHGAFIVYSRITPEDLLNEIKRIRPTVTSLDELITIFLLGPTPAFFGDNKATTSWRRSFVKYIDFEQCVKFNENFIVILPEPYDCDWKKVDYPNLDGKMDIMDHIYAQVHWEDYFINLAAKTGILVLHSHFRWSGNAGPTARMEAGKMFALMKENKLKGGVINYPIETETAQYIKSHLIDANELFHEGRFMLTTCSPVHLDNDNKPVDNKGNYLPAGVYSNGSIEESSLDPFFHEIVIMAIKMMML